MFLYQMSVTVGNTVRWTYNSSYHAHRNRTVFKVTRITRAQESLNTVTTFGMYTLDGQVLREEHDGYWIPVSKPIRVVWKYDDSVGGGFPEVIEDTGIPPTI